MSVTEISMQDRIQAFKLAARELPQTEIPTQHFILDGIYVRQTFIPKGTVFVGRVHKKPHFFMVLKGLAEVTMDESIVTLRAGMTLMCPPGTRRAGICLEDTVFAGVFRTEKTDLKDIEAELTEFDPTCRFGVGNEIQELECESSKDLIEL